MLHVHSIIIGHFQGKIQEIANVVFGFSTV